VGAPEDHGRSGEGRVGGEGEPVGSPRFVLLHGEARADGGRSEQDEPQEQEQVRDQRRAIVPVAERPGHRAPEGERSRAGHRSGGGRAVEEEGRRCERRAAEQHRARGSRGWGHAVVSTRPR
jgi:hypothetical protein